MKPVPLVIDTDAGDDIDDVLAIAFAALRPEINFLAVTTVTADSGRRAALVREVLDACGRPDIPVAAGADFPLSPMVDRWLPLQTWKDCPVVYDLAPVLHTFRPDLFRTERIGIGIDCGRSLAEGWTLRDNAAPRTVDVTTDMNAEAARALLLETLLQAP